MIERRIVRRYATALFSAASKAGVVDRVESDLGLITYVVESSADLLDAIRSPVVDVDRKRDILRALFADKIHEITLSYLDLLVDKRREEAILQTEEEYILLANEARGMVTVEVTTAVEMTAEEAAQLKAMLDKITGKHVVLEKTIDPEIIGGVVVRIEDRVIDGSIKGQLTSLREELLS